MGIINRIRLGAVRGQDADAKIDNLVKQLDDWENSLNSVLGVVHNDDGTLKDDVVNTDDIVDDAIDGSKIDFAATGADAGIWWEEIGRTTLTVAGDSLSVSSLPARKYLMFMADLVSSGALVVGLRFNGDGGANYGFRYTINNGLGAGSDATTAIASFGNSAHSSFKGEVTNAATRAKLGKATSLASNGTTRPDYVEFYFGWNNTSVEISSIDLINTGAGDFAIGSELIVLGHN